MIETKRISLDNKLVQSPGLIASNMDGEKVMLSVENGKYYNLGEIGGTIWDLIQNPLSVNQLVESIMQEYEVNREICEVEVINFLDSLLQEKLIVVCNE